MKLVLAVPSKGRLQENAAAFLADAGLALSGGAREYVGALAGLDEVEVVYLSAGEIAGALIAGRAHLGITGEDLLRETAPDLARVHLVRGLGFGHADVVVAVPRAWIDVAAMSDLDDVCLAFHARNGRRLRVATKYVNLTRAFFAAKGIADYRIVESLGATEGAPAAGAAEAIVDITSTGATLAANNLKVLTDGVILRSQAQLAASLSAPWPPGLFPPLRRILDQIAARARAKAMQIVRTRMPDDGGALLARLKEEQGCLVQSQPAPGNAAGEWALLVPRARLYAVVSALRAAGADGIVAAATADYLFTPDNALYDGLLSALSAADRR